MKNIKKIKWAMVGILILPIYFAYNSGNSQTPSPQVPPPDDGQGNIIKIALLLDVSGSMNGLIEQAKSQLWKIVNELSEAKKNGDNASIEIALYQYGDSRLNARDGYIKQVLPLTTDLDMISEKLFSLTTNGGEEYCGEVIKKAASNLDWNDINNGVNMIFIAGNESFAQGSVSYELACSKALNKGIKVNTIFCGDINTGINTFWKKGAMLGEGEYMNIDMNQSTVYVSTPYDDQIEALNDSLNTTYITYGTNGRYYQENQIRQDNNASNYGKQNKVLRSISKSKSVYSNSNWDLVDAAKEKNIEIEKVKTNQLPTEMQNMSIEERKSYVKLQTERREKFKKEISNLSVRRKEYVAQQNLEQNGSLDYAMLNAIRKQAINKGFTFDDNVNQNYPKAAVDINYFNDLTQEVIVHRSNRLVSYNEFKSMQNDKNIKTIVLDTRSKEMYDKMHLKGAIHLNFSNFNILSLSELIPDNNTRILIYCNNNFSMDLAKSLSNQMTVRMVDFRTAYIGKGMPRKNKKVKIKEIKANLGNDNYQLNDQVSNKTLALNIPTYINLYGYGYKNVYELNERISPNDPRLEMEGTDVRL